jgi:murein DD-endopeptidase MepM/ murein hydrolase activator NlpD
MPRFWRGSWEDEFRLSGLVFSCLYEIVQNRFYPVFIRPMNCMHTSIQETPVQRRNPFKDYPKSAPPQHPRRGNAAAMHTAAINAPRPKPSTPGRVNLPQPTHREEIKVAPLDDKTRTLRRQRYLKKHQFSWPFSLKLSLSRVGELLGVLLLIFILLPSSLQKQVFNAVSFKQELPVVSLPPLPLDYDYISSPFGHRWGRQHQGIDFAAGVGEPIYATSAGTVIYSGWESGYGKSIVLDHGNGIQTRYAHCSRLLLKKGAPVLKGAKIALVGSTGHSTGPHLHFEIIVDGVRKNPAWYFSFDHHQTSHLANAAHEGSSDKGSQD